MARQSSRRLLSWALLVGLLPACAVAPTARRQPACAPLRPIPAGLNEARNRIREHRSDEALRLLDEGRGIDLSEPERSWLLVALWNQHCGAWRARAATAALPRGAFADALRALSAEEPEAARALVQPWQGRGDPWANLAAAVAATRMSDAAAALGAATQALPSSSAFVTNSSVYAAQT